MNDAHPVSAHSRGSVYAIAKVDSEIPVGISHDDWVRAAVLIKP